MTSQEYVYPTRYRIAFFDSPRHGWWATGIVWEDEDAKVCFISLRRRVFTVLPFGSLQEVTIEGLHHDKRRRELGPVQRIATPPERFDPIRTLRRWRQPDYAAHPFNVRMGPTVAERKAAQLRRLKEKYGDHPEAELVEMARAEFARLIAELKKRSADGAADGGSRD